VAAFERNRVHLVGSFPELEDQLTSFTADLDRARSGSPDRADGMIWALTELLVDKEPYAALLQWYAAEVARLRAAGGAPSDTVTLGFSPGSSPGGGGR
jgi:hypothetical protein